MFDEKLLDVSDIAGEAGKQQGGWYDAAKEAAVVNGKWKTIPFSNIGLMDQKQVGGWYASADTYYQPLLHGYDTRDAASGTA